VGRRHAWYRRAMAKVTSYVALLRGINVGGKNIIPMADLKACFEAQGLADVRTYIASGNVLFDAPKVDEAKLERALAKAFDYDACVVVRSRDELDAVVAGAPRGFGKQPKKFRYDVLFLKHPLTADDALPQVPLADGVDAAAAGPGVLYFSRLIAKATKSRMNRIVGLPIYKSLTIRNWNTTTKLAALLAER
jgi:uncharacterized protein (DUF1697 family)